MFEFFLLFSLPRAVEQIPVPARSQTSPIDRRSYLPIYYYPGLIPPAPRPKRPLSLNYPLLDRVPITSRFGSRTHPVTGDQRFHAGLDLGAAMGAPVVAAASGRVVSAQSQGGYGLAIVLEHGDGTDTAHTRVRTLYGHLSVLLVRSGTWVEAGQVIGQVGSTGLSTGPHLHFEVHRSQASDWVAVNPEGVLGRSIESIHQVASTTPGVLADEERWVQRLAW